MESTPSSRNFKAEFSTTTAKQTLDSDCIFSMADYLLNICPSTAPFIVNAALNVALSIVTTIANILVFDAIRKSTSLHLPSKLLLCGLVLTDLAVGLIYEPLNTAFLISKDPLWSDTQCILGISATLVGNSMSCASLLTMTVMSLDRYIAFHFHLRYKEIVTAKRVVVSLVAVWFVSVFVSSTLLWNVMAYSYLVLGGGSFLFLVTSLAYIKIYYGLRHQHGHQVQPQAQVEAQQQAGNTLNVAKYRRSASSMLWIYCVFILCYLPYIFILFAARLVGQYAVFMSCVTHFATTVVSFNSCLNPFLYCYRLPEIRAGVLQTLRRMCCHSPQQ